MTRILAAVAGGLVAFSAVVAQQNGAAPAKGEPAAPPKASPFQPPEMDLTKPTLFVVGYAHLDTQWRWTYIDTIKEYIPNTLQRNFALFDKYPGYIFNFSGSRRYRMMEEYYPADYERLKGYVAAGRWFPCGSSVDENDANVPSAESLVRQVLYGNRYFREKFGVASDEYMLPDCFGFPAALPSVLSHCGVKGFSTQKLTWNAVVPIPFKVGVWEGPDGNGVVAALDPGAYVGDVKENLSGANSWIQRIKASGDTSGVYADYHYFGTGDQGGSPKEASVAMVEKSVGTDGPIHVISSAADWLCRAITPEMRAKLPKYKGELELTEHSAGSITSEAYMKRWNRKNELLADAAERASVGAWWMGARPYPATRLEDAWYLVLGSQMHDILPGTSLPKAYDLSWNDECLAANQFGGVLEDAAGAVIGSMNTAGKGAAVVVFNPLSVEREDVVEADVPAAGLVTKIEVTGPDGALVPGQILHAALGSSSARVAFLAKAPSVGFAAYDVQVSNGPVDEMSPVMASERQLDNTRYTVKLNDDGDVASIVDKKTGGEVLGGPARLGLHYENPANWPAWNQDWADRQKPARAYVGDKAGGTPAPRFRVIERGPARVAVEVTRECEGSTFTQRIRLCAGGASDRIEFDTDIDWRTRMRSLRAAFPLLVSAAAATYDIQTGVIERGNGQPKQFEYAFHQWFDLTSDDNDRGAYGVSVLCDSKYGADKPDDHTVRLTLLHTPGTRGGYPDQGSQDLGRHHVLYALYGHPKDWTDARTPEQAARLNQPLVPFVARAHEGPLGKTFSMLRVSSPAVAVTAMKKAEASDEVVVRLRELNGETAKGVRVGMANPIVSAREVDGQERALGDATVQNGELVTDVRGFSLRAFALNLGRPHAPSEGAKGTPVPLAFDTDAVSTNTNRVDGGMDEQGRTFPAEMLPGSIVDDGVEFKLGSGTDGQKNAVACRGQQIAVPAGAERLCLLAAASEDLTSSVSIDGAPTPWAVQAWTGYVGQWDHRLWKGDVPEGSYSFAPDIVGLEPGYVKPARVAWHASHHHTPGGDAVYQYCYLFKYDLDLPAGAKTVTLPNEPRIKVFAATATAGAGAGGAGRATAAASLSDTLADHVQDAPVIVPAGGTFTDATEIRVEPRLYWRAGAIRYTTDGSDPTAQSAVYSGPIALARDATVKASAVTRDGGMGPVASASFKVSDTTAPALKQVSGLFGTPRLWARFSEPLAKSALEASRFALEPAIAVTSVVVGEDSQTLILTLASPPEAGKAYHLKARGIQDTAPTPNTLADGDAEFSVQGPVYSLDEVTKEQIGTAVRDVKGLPVKAHDAWTLNLFVRTAKQPASHTVFAGFGACTGSPNGSGRYLCKFANGVHFWSANRDVEGRSPVELNRWQMLTATYDGATLRLYKDGKKLAEQAAQFVDDENVVWIAPKDPWDKRYQFDGEIRGLTIWPAALPEDAITALRAAATLP